MRDRIFELAASQLVELRDFELFHDMLKQYPDIARAICLRAETGPKPLQKRKKIRVIRQFGISP